MIFFIKWQFLSFQMQMHLPVSQRFSVHNICLHLIQPPAPTYAVVTGQCVLSLFLFSVTNYSLFRVRTDPGKVWKVMEFKVEILQVWKIMENDLRYGKVMESVNSDYSSI